MRISAFLLFIGILQVFASDSYSQVTRLTLSMSDATVQQVLAEIETQSEFYILFNHQLVDVNRKVNIKVSNKKINNILTALFKGTDIKHFVMGRQIILSPQEILYEGVGKKQRMQEAIEVKGTIVDKNGDPLPGVNIVVKGTAIGTISNMDGNYTIDVPNENSILVFSFVGHVIPEIIVGKQTIINLTLIESAIGIDEVVVIGYGTQKKVNLTGAVASVNSEVFENRSTTDVSQALQGIIPNLNLTTTNNTELGESLNWNIRGTTSLSGGEPYILVDDVPMDLKDVNPNDIESVTVLKDAASSAIYGSRAAYGVVLITTKKGRKNEGVKLSYSNNFSLNSPTLLPEMASSIDFVELWNYAYENAGRSPVFFGERLEMVEKYYADPENTPSCQRYPEDHAKWNRWGAYYRSNGNEDWYPIWFKNNALHQTHNVSIQGGSNKSTYYISGGFLNQEGLLNFGDDDYSRYNISARFESDITDWFKFKLNTKYTERERHYPNTHQESSNSKSSLYYNIGRQWAVMPLYDPNGHIFDRNQILPLLDGGSTEKWNNLWVTVGAELELIKDWKIFIDYSRNNGNSITTKHEPIIYGYNCDETTFILTGNPNYISKNYNNSTYYTLNAYTNYEKTYKGNNIKLMLGYQEELQNYNNLYGSRKSLITDNVPSISTATSEIPYLDDGIGHWATRGIFGRLNYNYKEKFLAEINFRYDGSSRFEEGKRWGFFPSMSMGYRISEEPFWSGIKNVVNNLKLRGSWGKLGNQDVSNYLYISTIPIRTNLPYYLNNGRPVYTTAPGLISADLTWEVSSTIDFGADAGFINNKLNLSFDWYKRTTDNMFGPTEALPATLGASIPKKNNATLETKGFELSIDWKDKIGTDIDYYIKLGLSDYVATVTNYANPTKILTTYYEGKTIGEIWGYTSGGLFASDEEAAEYTQNVDQSYLYKHWYGGDMKYIDLNNDGKIDNDDNTVDDPGDLSVIGNWTPHYSFGLQCGLNWKGFDFSMFWQGVAKKDAYMNSNMYNGISGSEWSSSVFIQHLDYWTPENTDAFYPRPYMSKSLQRKNFKTQTRFLINAAYMRLKSVQMGYVIPENIIKKVYLNRVRVYVSGENLLTFTKVPKMFDPEGLNRSGRVYPIIKSVSVGTSITF